jgi:hypothetical protein
MFQNIGVLYKVCDFDITVIFSREKSKYKKQKYIFYSRVRRRQLGECKEEGKFTSGIFLYLRVDFWLLG